VRGVRLSGTGSRSYAELLISTAAAFLAIGALLIVWSRKRRARIGL